MLKLRSALIILMLCIWFDQAGASSYPPLTTLSMSCVIISPEDKWTYRDYGFSIFYRDVKHIQHETHAISQHTLLNCTQPFLSVQLPLVPGMLQFKLEPFVGQKGSSIECTNIINYELLAKNLGQICEFMVKTPKYGTFTSTDECSLQMNCHPPLQNH